MTWPPFITLELCDVAQRIALHRDQVRGLAWRQRADLVGKAIARAHRWKRMLETGPYTSLRELAAAEKINESYLARVLRLTLLAPDILEAITDGRTTVELGTLLESIPVAWDEQHSALSLRP